MRGTKLPPDLQIKEEKAVPAKKAIPNILDAYSREVRNHMTDPWRTSSLYSSSSPCMHALVIGVSHYQYLPENSLGPIPEDGRVTLGLCQATTPAYSALSFASWLESEYNNPDIPMGSIRLLLSPSTQEEEQEDALANLEPHVLHPTARNVKEALFAWKRDCEKSRNNLGIFYIAGHGIQLSKDDSIVLLEDFANPNDNILAGAIDIGSVWRGMSNENAAKIQFYFVDSCRIKPDIFTKYEKNPVGVTLDVTDEGTVEAAPIFFSAAPRTHALGELGKGTLFCQALMDCFKLHAVDWPDQQGRWMVTTSSLNKWLGRRVMQLALEYNEVQDAVPGGLMKDVPLHILTKPPNVPVIIGLDPKDAAEHHALAKLQDGITDKVIFENRQFTPELEEEVPGGSYLIHITFPPEEVMFRNRQFRPLFVHPPKTKEIINV